MDAGWQCRGATVCNRSGNSSSVVFSRFFDCRAGEKKIGWGENDCFSENSVDVNPSMVQYLQYLKRSGAPRVFCLGRLNCQSHRLSVKIAVREIFPGSVSMFVVRVVSPIEVIVFGGIGKT